MCLLCVLNISQCHHFVVFAYVYSTALCSLQATPDYQPAKPAQEDSVVLGSTRGVQTSTLKFFFYGKMHLGMASRKSTEASYST